MVYIEFIQGKLDGTPKYIHDRDIECCRKRMTLSLMAASLLRLSSFSPPAYRLVRELAGGECSVVIPFG